jgi:SAM-dependent methyltransferase
MTTFTGTLAQALKAGAVPIDAFGLVLYQFVLEHLSDPAREIALAARTLVPGGIFAAVVPSMDAIEAGVFGGSYRSFRADHLHVFSLRSIKRLLRAAGLRPLAHETECNLHLLHGFVTPTQLRELETSGKGPDLIVVARRPAR